MELKKGYTLIEALVAVTLMGIVIVTATAMFFTTVKNKYQIESYAVIKQSGGYALNVMTKEIKNARSAAAAANTLTLTDINDNTIIFNCLTDNYILMQTDSPRYLVANGLLDGSCTFAVTTAEPPSVRVEFTLAKESMLLGEVRHTFKKTVSLRTY
jgi:prepilin-type N-terminal cleavage/methylation domain-containing protein